MGWTSGLVVSTKKGVEVKVQDGSMVPRVGLSLVSLKQEKPDWSSSAWSFVSPDG